VSEECIDWTFGFNQANDYARDHAVVEWEGYGSEDESASTVLNELADSMRDVLDAICKAACRRLKEIGYAQVEYRDSDEYIDEFLEDNDHYLFDEEGERA